MKIYGDAPASYKALALKLETAELEVDQFSMPAGKKAQAYVCLASDWYDLGMEEEGERLLTKAETTSPTYFDELIVQHMKEDPNFEYLVRNISSELATLAIGYLVTSSR